MAAGRYPSVASNAGNRLASIRTMLLDGHVEHLVATYGAWLVGSVIGLESMGIPLPGETTLVTAALYAGTTGRLSITSVLIAAAVGAIVGDNIGFLIGRTLGYRWIVRHQSTFRLNPKRLKLGQYLFLRHGGKVVFFGRFVAVLRAFAALLAGINRMPWQRFVVFNMIGAVIWASAYGGAAYVFGDRLGDAFGKTGVWLSAAAVALVVIGILLARKYEERLSEKAERQIPGPLPA